MNSSKRQMRQHSVGLFFGAIFFMFGLPMTIFAYQAWSLVIGYIAVAVMFVASIGFGIRALATTKDALWLGGEIILFFIALYAFYCFVWLPH